MLELVVDRDAAAVHSLARLHIENSLIASAIGALEDLYRSPNPQAPEAILLDGAALDASTRHSPLTEGAQILPSTIAVPVRDLRHRRADQSAGVGSNPGRATKSHFHVGLDNSNEQ